MKTLLMLLSVIMLCSACTTAPLRDTRPDAGLEEGGIFAEIEEAVTDLAANTPKLIEMHKRTDAASSEHWNVAIAHRIPEQPIAVIQIMAKVDVPIDSMCPRVVIEDELSSEEYAQWMNEAIAALDSFTLNDPNTEYIRKKCLRAIKCSLANRDNWSY